jgi:hypothetical protein
VGCPLVDAFGRGAFELPGGGLCRPLTGPPLVGPRGRNRPVISFSKLDVFQNIRRRQIVNVVFEGGTNKPSLRSDH